MERMNQEYKDIISRLGAPLWWDECSVPRYEAFTPDQCNDIYADEVCLLEIGCQHCGEKFLVAVSWDRTDGILQNYPTLTGRVKAGLIHWGDPPLHNCIGDTESCDDLRVIEFWVKDRINWDGWQRVPELEGELQAE